MNQALDPKPWLFPPIDKKHNYKLEVIESSWLPPTNEMFLILIRYFDTTARVSPNLDPQKIYELFIPN